jgi:D-glycero-D-manno-heptose 1,7-bisphosphate phosphatase
VRDYPENPKVGWKRAVFLDRDGTINVDTHYPHKIEDLEIYPEALKGMKILSELSADLIVITNQSGIALELYEERDMSAFNQELREQLQKEGSRIDAIYYCPHFEKKNPQYNETTKCNCSKPLPGLLVEAAADYQLDLTKSFLIGDKTSDIAAGHAAGCKTILVLTGKGGKEDDRVPVTPDFIVADLYEAALIVEKEFLK